MGSLVICWWGPHLFLLDPLGRLERCAQPEGADPASALLAALAGGPGGPKCARIIYQPESLESHEIDPPLAPAGRARIRRKLAGRFPGLAGAGTAWCVTAQGGSGPALLHLEARSPLPGLAAGLSRAGLEVDGAWPLAALAESGPETDSVSLAAARDRGFVAWKGPGGESGLEFHAGEGFADAIAAALRRARARFEENAGPSGWLAVEEGPSAGAIREVAHAMGLREIGMAEFFGRARLLSPRAPSNLLPPPPWIARPAVRRRIAAAVVLASLVGAAGLGWSWHIRSERRRLEQAEASARRSRLEAETAAGLARQDQVRRLSAECATVATPPQHHAELLLALLRATPRAIVVRRLAANGGDFTIEGSVLPGADPAENPLAALRHGLSAPEAPWTLPGGQPAPQGPDFAILGRFRESEPFPDCTPALPELAARLAERRSLLRSEANFDSHARPWGPHWVVTRQSRESAFGWEVRRYDLAYDRARLDDWPDIVETVKTCCGEPGLTIDRLALASPPEGCENFLQAEISLTVRLRR